MENKVEVKSIPRYEGIAFEEYVAQYYLNKVRGSGAREIEFSLTVTEVRTLLNKKTCAYSGLKMSHVGAALFGAQEKTRYADLTLERMDHNKGYVKGNVIAVCYGFNQLKGTFENPSHPAKISNLIKFLETIKALNLTT